MFDVIKNNLHKINNIYILLAETHAEISHINKTVINNNAVLLKQQIQFLLQKYLELNNISYENCNIVYNKVRFIFQNNFAKYHLILTYNFFNLIGTGKLLKNPIYDKSKIKSVAFLLSLIISSYTSTPNVHAAASFKPK